MRLDRDDSDDGEEFDQSEATNRSVAAVCDRRTLPRRSQSAATVTNRVHARLRSKNSTTWAGGDGRLKSTLPAWPSGDRRDACPTLVLAFGIDDPRGAPAADTAVADKV